MTEQELKAILECKNINDTTGTILGIHPKTGKSTKKYIFSLSKRMT